MSRYRRARTGAATVLAVASLACLSDSPLTPSEQTTGSALLAVQASVSADIAPGDQRQVEIRVFYRRTGGGDQTILTEKVHLSPGVQTSRQLTVNLASCLSDRLRIGASEGGCRLSVELRLVGRAGEVLDAQTVEPEGPARPGQTVRLPGAITLAEVGSLEIDPAPTLVAGDTLTLTARVRTGGGMVVIGKQLAWASANPAIVRVDPSTGKITAWRSGTAEISATTAGKTARASVTVVLPTFSRTDLPQFGSGAFGVNDAGHVAGMDANYRAAVWVDGAVRRLGGVPDMFYSMGLGINGRGQVAGMIDGTGCVVAVGTCPRFAFLWQNDQVVVVGALGGSYGVATAINQNGAVAGYSETAAPFVEHAFVWTPSTPGGTSGTTRDLGVLPGFTISRALGINAAGQVVGFVTTDLDGGLDAAVMWTPAGQPVRLGLPSGYASCRAEAINDDGQIVGECWDSQWRSVPFLWTPSERGATTGTMTTLTTLGGSNAGAYGINNRGQIVGYSTTAQNQQHAVFWTAAGELVDLGQATEARAISGSGRIVGSGAQRALMWTPDTPR